MSADPPHDERIPSWRRHWRSLSSRYARPITVVVVVAGGVAAAGHFVGGMLGWWEAYERVFGHRDSAATAQKTLPAKAEPLSIVVLPLAVDGEDADAGWFADALLGDVIAEVALLPGSVVIARDTAFSYKGRTVDPREVARELRVRYVVRGSVRRDGEDIRLDLALVDGETGRQRWSERFVAERAQVGRAIDEFVQRLGRSLTIEVTRSAGERAAALSPTEVSADDLAMRAFALWYRGFTRENITEALALLDRAVAMDPQSVRGWAGLSFMNLNSLSNGWAADRAATMRRLEEARGQLERLDADGNYTYQARVIRVYLKGDHAQLLRIAEAWTERHGTAIAFGALGAALYLNGRADEAVAPLEKALRLSPRDTYRAEWQYRLALAHFIAARYELARDWGRTAQASNPELSWPPVHAAALLRLGRDADARQLFDDFAARHPKYGEAQLLQRLPGMEPRFVEGRDRLKASLKELGLR